MRTIGVSTLPQKAIFNVLIDLGALAFIYLVPTISHLLQFPVYLIEPMRLMLIFSLVHTNKTNSYLIAMTMPLFSYFISGHPIFAKTLLIAFELMLNVYLFYWLSNKFKKVFPSILASIFISKLVYYLVKFGLISLLFIDSSLISTPIWIQLITMSVFSVYVFFFYKRTTD